MCACARAALDQWAEYFPPPRLLHVRTGAELWGWEGILGTHQRHLLPDVCVCVVGTGADVRRVFESVTAHCLPTQLKIPSHGPLTRNSPFGQRDHSTGGCGIAAVFHFRVP